MSDKSFQDALEENIAMITNSTFFLSIWNDDMTKFKNDPWPAIQLTLAVILDKPIIIWAPPGRTVPEKLRRIADEIVEGELSSETEAKLKAAFERLAPRQV